jgi:hypothetical protein
MSVLFIVKEEGGMRKLLSLVKIVVILALEAKSVSETLTAVTRLSQATVGTFRTKTKAR